ncbi:DUF3800 domain-containing protein [Pseudomonas typographi]|uniref:DUF3800 domain-containing protein n=1 Tax=Pseudomonas typographi TaxID=2715964 RepID=UPI0016870F3B|nr:DUF3800 domain-containing protein [Pseudomonas typographi]MBD1555137.1 DUF3800 domain-containing protein [Pseudomonas typographi]
MECFRIDESGYTGYDLLNQAQPFQGSSAIAIGDDDAARLIQEHFPKLQAPELKYKALSRRRGNHPRLLALIRDVLQNYKCVTHVCDKRYLLLLKYVDYAVEPFYFDRGFDLYKEGQNYSMASLLYYAGPGVLGREAMAALEKAFQDAMKLKTSESLAHLVTRAQAADWQALPEAIGPLAQFADQECLEAIATPGVTTDIAFIILMALITRMEAMAAGPYRVEHDQTKNLATFHDILQRQIDHDGTAEFRQSAIAALRFPLKLQEVTQVDSKNSPAVQLADVMIGAAIEAGQQLTGRVSEGLDPDALMGLYADDQIIHMLPSLDFAGQRAFRQGTQASELMDYFAKHFSG